MMFDSEMKFKNVIQKIFNRRLCRAKSRRTRVEDETNLRNSLKANFKKKKEKSQKKKIQIEFKINDKIFLNAKNIISIKSFKKLNYKYYDLYTINELINKILYKFNFALIMKNIHDVFHVFFKKFVNNKNDKTSSFI
jgi:hypothetical protein